MNVPTVCPFMSHGYVIFFSFILFHILAPTFSFFFIINITVVCSQSGRGLLASAQATNLFFCIFVSFLRLCVRVFDLCYKFSAWQSHEPSAQLEDEKWHVGWDREREHPFSVVMIYVEIGHPKFACPNNADEKRCCECTRAYSTNSTGKKKETQPTIKWRGLGNNYQ